MYRSIPDLLLPELKGRILVNRYLRGKSGAPVGTSDLAKAVLRTPGTNRSLAAYLNSHADKIVPKIVGHHLGDHWYTGPAKGLAGLPYIRDIVISKILDKTLPKIDGSTSLAGKFLAAGGNL